jgi:hypothetical protein
MKTDKNPRTSPFNLRGTPAVLLTLVFICFLSFTAGINVFAQQYDSAADFEYGWDQNVKDGIEITKYIGSKKEVRIPPTIQNLKVTSIGATAFRYNNNVTSVIIPNGVISINGSGRVGGAFQSCPNLTSVTIPNSVTSIGPMAFTGSTGLPSITIPNSVITIGNEAFKGCTGLTRVNIGTGVTTIGMNAFNGCTSLPSIIIPRNVNRIEGNAFQDCTSLNSVTFQGAIVRSNFGVLGLTGVNGNPVDLFPGNLAARYLDTDGGVGTYIRLANGQTWRKQ